MSIFNTKYEIRDTRYEKGAVLLFTLMVMITLISVVGAYLGFVQHSTKSTGAQITDSKAIYVAEAGLQRYVYFLKTDQDYRDDCPDLSENFGDGNYSVQASLDQPTNTYTITSTGTVGGLSRTIEQTVTVDSGWTEIIYDEFESDFGNWTDGGDDCLHYTHPQGTHAHQGNAAVNLQANTDTSVVTTGDLSLSAYDDEVKVNFWYKAVGMDSNEDFWLQISTNGGGDYTTVQSWAEGTDFQNGTFYEESVTITGYSLTDQTRIRFRCDASNNGDDVYIDEIRVLAYSDDGAGEVTVENVVDTWQEL